MTNGFSGRGIKDGVEARIDYGVNGLRKVRNEWLNIGTRGFLQRLWEEGAEYKNSQ